MSERNISRKPFIVYWNNIPAPYMVERFNALSDHSDFNFEAWFNQRVESDRSWEVNESEWRFNYRYMSPVTVGGKRLHYPLPLVKRGAPDVLVSLYAEPSFLLGWAIAKLREIKIGFWVERTFDSWVNRTFLKETVKRWLFPKVDFVVTAGKDGEKYVKRYGVRSENIFFAPHVIDVSHYKSGSNIDLQTRAKLREKLCLKGTTFLYVGRILRKKGLDFLLDAFKEVQKKSDTAVSLLLVGDGSDEDWFQSKCNTDGLHNVVFAGFRQKSEISSMYAIADIFVFPTLGDPYGLVIDEAMACKLPVVTTSAVGEINERIVDDHNGYIVPPASSNRLAEAMLKLVGDPETRKRMGARSGREIDPSTPERWAKDFEGIISNILNRP